MTKKQPIDPIGLRRRAESRLQNKTPPTGAPQSADDPQRLIHELQVHQVELEMQNEELRYAWEAVEVGRARYTELYDFAPMGYFTLELNGEISQTNLNGASLLGIDRARLSGTRFDAFLAGADRSAFTSFLKQVFAAAPDQTCVVELARKDQPPRTLHIGAALTANGEQCRVAVVDITGLKQTEAKRAQPGSP